MDSLKSEIALGDYFPNIGTLLSVHSRQFFSRAVFGQRIENRYRFWTWQKLFQDVLCFVRCLKGHGLKVGDRVAFMTGRSYLRMAAELAVMAGGYVSIPLFKGYPAIMKSEMLKFSEASLLVTEDDGDLRDLDPDDLPVRTLDSVTWDLADACEDLQIQEQFAEIRPDHPALVLFTSGTTAFPKGVVITHRNVLAQQRAHQILWNLQSDFKVLSYLPWDHVFGSLFERFLTLYSGACLCLDDSAGKDIPRLLENFSIVQPEYFFSVPLVYDRIRDHLIQNPQWESRFFHPRLRFIFTASAPLSPNTAAYFQKKNLPMVEGWGLTETSPSCTLTQPSLDPSEGGVGLPIPGVEIKISRENEILVRGHNVMMGYFNAPEETREVLDGEGWLKTGDLGEISSSGLKVHGRKDRLFKLSNGRKVNPAEMENDIKTRCPWIHQLYIFGNGKRFSRGLVFVEPNQDRDGFQKIVETTVDLLEKWNGSLKDTSKRLDRIALVEQGLSLERGEMTPSLKIRPKVLEENYRDLIKILDSEKTGWVQDGVWIQRLREEGGEPPHRFQSGSGQPLWDKEMV